MKKINIYFIVWVVLTLFVTELVHDEVNIITPEIYERVMDNIDIGSSDLKKYKAIFKAIDKGDFKTVDNLVEKLDNQCLLGYVLAEKYLHASYKSTLEELEAWLEEYRDYPQSARIYKIALKKGAKEIKEPVYHSDDDVIDVNESIQAYDKLKSIDSKNIELKIIENE